MFWQKKNYLSWLKTCLSVYDPRRKVCMKIREKQNEILNKKYLK